MERHARCGLQTSSGWRSEHESHVGAQTLGFVRAWVFGIWLLKIAVAPLSPLAELPASIFEPLLFMRVVPTDVWSRLLRPDALTGFQMLLCLCVTLTALGVRPYRPIAIMTSITLTFHQGLIRSFGHVNHHEIALLLATYVLAVFPAADGFTWRPRYTELQVPAAYEAPIVLMAALLLLPYTGSAAYRMAHHGLVTLTGESLTGFIVQNSFNHGYELIGTFILHHPTIAQLLQFSVPIVAILEWAAPLALVSRHFRWLWLAFASVFHVSSWLLLHIFFWESLLLAVVVLPALDRVTTTILPRSAGVALQ